MDFFSSAVDVRIHVVFFSLLAYCWDPDALLNNLNIENLYTRIKNECC